jgi:hypothetical protein
MQWYYSKNSTQLGPVSQDELRAKLASGEVSPADLVWRDGLPDWKPASEMAELALGPATGGPPALTGGQSPYAPPSMAAGSAGGMIPNYLWQSIVVTILCCWPLGIPAIVYAAKVDGLKARGDVQGAISASASAKKWCWIAVAGWGVVFVIYVVIVVSMAFFGRLTPTP